MRTHSSLIGTLALLLSAPTVISVTTVTTAAAAASAGPVRVIQSDEIGITLQLDVPELTLVAQRDGRSVLQAGSLDLTSHPGRPALPYASALIALPSPDLKREVTADVTDDTDRDQIILD